MTQKIKFGTDGWRAIIAKEYTTDNLARVAQATAKWIKKQTDNHKVVIGFDCRFGGKMFMETAIAVFINEGIEVIADNHFVTTPMISLCTQKYNAFAGIVITASHNPPSYNGFKIKAQYGGPALQKDIDLVESEILDTYDGDYSFTSEIEQQVTYVSMHDDYIECIEKAFNLDLIKKSGMGLAFDAMYGAGQKVVPSILPDTTLLHCEENPSFNNQAPEPIARNLQPFSKLIAERKDITSGLAIDGDADRIGLFDENGNFVDSHHIILLLIKYLVEVKGYSGKVVNSFSCTSKIKKLTEHFNLPHQTSKIGFKYICEIMVNEDCLLGGEESGGIAVKGHIPERDGIWVGLILWEYMAKTGKKLTELIQDVYDIVGSFAMDRYDLRVTEEQKNLIISRCKSQAYNQFGKYQIQNFEDLDGFKFHLSDDRWVMIRPSGTEPVLRVYAQSDTQENTIHILDETKKAILS
jgi:phosphomannomutase